MTAFTFQLALLFFPGIICGLIVEQLAVQGKWDAFRFVLYCFILGLASYLLYALVTNAWYCRWPTRLPLIHSVRHPKHIIFGDVLWATVAAVPLAFFDYPRRQSRLASLARAEGPRVHVSNKFSDADVWGYLFNIPTEETKWVIVLSCRASR